ncbi:MAG: histidine kinase N-terminal 7TM domain-containing protein, partial [Chloroflexota bacterium]
MTYPVYAVLLIISGAISIITAGLSWRGRTAPGAIALAVMMVAMAVWSWMYALYWLVSAPELKRVALDLTYVGAFVSTPAFLVLAFQFTGYGHWFTRRAFFILSILPTLSFL